MLKRISQLAVVACIMFLHSGKGSGFNGPIRVELGRPNIWSLEQAHYLLSRMHAENLDLQSQSPSPLDPNAINGTRIDILRNIFTLGAGFDQIAAVQNQAAATELRSLVNRRERLRGDLDDLRAESADLAEKISRAEADLGPDDEEPSELKDLKARQAGVDAELTSVEEELKQAFAAPAFEEIDMGQASTMPDFTGPGTLKDVLEGTGFGAVESSLHASTQLDNHIQMQYEVIAKQLTLLRDEVGPDEQLVFLELPVSFHTQPKRAKNRLIRVSWTVYDVCAADRELLNAIPGHVMEREPVAQQQILADCLEAKSWEQLQKERQGLREEIELNEVSADSQKASKDLYLENVEKTLYKRNEALAEAVEQKKSRSIEYEQALRAVLEEEDFRTGPEGAFRREVFRTVDIIPRTSALNVTQAYNRQRGFGLSGKFLAIFGFGLVPNYQRDRQLYEQFVHQRSFATGFGKGRSIFGWTFGPVPGQRIISPGARTTYAVGVVPKDSVALYLAAEACFFKRDRMPNDPFLAESGDKCHREYFQIPVPAQIQSNSFYLQRAYYNPVRAGERVTVVFKGTNFSPQLGILVNGVPLRKAVSIADKRLVPRVGSNSSSSDRGQMGEFELVNSETLVAQFQMGADYAGTPIIAFVTPQKSWTINWFNILINQHGRTTLREVSVKEPMFLPDLDLSRLSFESLTKAAIFGSGFGQKTAVYIDGIEAKVSDQNTHRLELDLQQGVSASAGSFQVRLEQRNGQNQEVVEKDLPNLSLPVISGYEILAWDEGTRMLEVRLEGENFASKMDVQVTDGKLKCHAVLSDTQLRLSFSTLAADAVDVSLSHQATPGFKAYRTIAIPHPPTITAITPGKGSKDDLVNLGGDHFGNVTQAFFGDKEAAIQAGHSAKVMWVKVPGGEKGSRVPVRLLTSIILKGQRVSNADDFAGSKSKAYFTYEK
ncbi:MAG TPA: hypothetical protein VLU25_05965 [Acidobacteriota bacterium]|nr:hypothetical protein [Acidobacteriota bacterium]